MSRIICTLFVILMPSMAFAEVGADSCTLLEAHEKLLTEKEKEKLEKYGFAVGLVWDERAYPPVIVSKTVEKSCGIRYLIASYFSDKIAGEERFMKNVSITEDDRKRIANASCKALELNINGSGVWRDGMGHEIYNIVDDIIFPYFFSCISDRIALNQSFGAEHFSENAFLNPNKRLVDQIYNSVRKNPSRYRSSAMATRLFILKNGGRISGLNTEAMLRAGPDQKTEIPRDEVIKISLSLLRQEEKISLKQYSDFEHALWGH